MESLGALWISSGMLEQIELSISEEGLLNMTLDDLDVGDVEVKSGSSKIPNTWNESLQRQILNNQIEMKEIREQGELLKMESRWNIEAWLAHSTHY